MTNNLIDQVAGDNAFSTPLQLVALAPITPPRDENGVLYDRPTTTYYNGLIDVEDAQRSISNFRILTNTYLNLHLYKGLTWRNELGFDLYTTKENARYGERTDAGQGIGGYGFSNYGENQNLSTKSYMDYINTFGDFSVSAVLGIEFQKTVLDNTWVEGEQFPLLRPLKAQDLSAGDHQPKRSTLSFHILPGSTSIINRNICLPLPDVLTVHRGSGKTTGMASSRLHL
jgi:hypothetical protein